MKQRPNASKRFTITQQIIGLADLTCLLSTEKPFGLRAKQKFSFFLNFLGSFYIKQHFLYEITTFFLITKRFYDA